MALYSLNLRLPAGLDNEKAGSFASAPCEGGPWEDGTHIRPLAGTALRDGHDHRSAWTLQWLFDEKPDAQAFGRLLIMIQDRLALNLPPVTSEDLHFEIVPETDWLTQSYRQFEPFHESGFYIYGSHVDAPDPGDDIALQIDAATAFGSGEHGTTAGCLQILHDLHQDGVKPGHVLDLGTGSGILAVAAWKLWQGPVLATDIDEEAVRVAARHRDMNGVPAKAMTCITVDGFADPALQARDEFDVSIANILAGPLKILAHDLVAVTKPGGWIILSGMLDEQVADVLAVYSSLGCALKSTVMRGDWAAVLLQKN
jgi:ribosomal protein L11 methyltransferase